MLKMSTIHERIKVLVDRFADGNNSKFAILTDTSEANIRNYIKDVQPKFSFLQNVANKFEINCEWLLTGKSEMNAVEEPLSEYKKKSDDQSKYIELYERLLKSQEEKIKILEEERQKYYGK